MKLRLRDAAILSMVALRLAPATPAVAADALDCDQIKSPEGYSYYEVADVPMQPGSGTAAEQLARERARDQLLAKLAPGQCGRDALRSQVQHYRIGRAKGRICADALIPNESYAVWNAVHKSDSAFRRQLAAAAKSAVGLWKSGAAAEARPKIALHLPKSSPQWHAWLAGLWNESLAAAGATPVALNGEWSGKLLPKGIDAVVTPQTLEPTGAADMVFVNWEVRLGDLGPSTSLIRAFGSEVSACIAPQRVELGEAVAPSNAPLRLEIKGGRTSGFCEGDRIEIHLVSTAGQPLHVRVLDLWGDNGGQQMWPNAKGASDTIHPGEHVAVAAADSAIVLVNPTGLTSERFLVLAATDPEVLDRAIGPAPRLLSCLFDAGFASRIANWRKPPAGSTWLRQDVVYLSGGNCREANPATRLLAAEQLEASPRCH